MKVYIIPNWTPYANHRGRARHCQTAVQTILRKNHSCFVISYMKATVYNIMIIYDLPQRKYRYHCENQSDK